MRTLKQFKGPKHQGGWIQLAAAAIPAITSALGARRQQSDSQAMAREQMKFQERMSSTAHQRAAKDLEKAGLNRILALGSPASSPGGAMGQAQNVLGSAASSAMAGASMAATVRNQKLQGDIIAPEAHRARILLKIQQRAAKGVKEVARGARTYPMPDPGVPGTPVKLADSTIGRSITKTMNRLNDITMGRTKNSIETPASAREVRQGTHLQHIEQWVLDYEDKHGRQPTEKEIRDEWARSKKYY